MSTPITVRQREQARINRQFQNQQQNSRFYFPPSNFQMNQQFTNNQNNFRLRFQNRRGSNRGSRGSSVNRSSHWQYRSRNDNFSSDNFENSPIYQRFDWDDWVMQQPTTTGLHNLNDENDFFSSPVVLNVDPENVVLFQGSKSPFSTFYETPVRILSVTYPCVENYYQACKVSQLVGQNSTWKLMSATNGAKAKQLARDIIREHKVSPLVVEQWKETFGINAIYYGTYFKFFQDPELRKRLFETGDKLIIHDYLKDSLYSSGCDAKALKAWLEDHIGKRLEIEYNLQTKQQRFPTIGNGQNVTGYVNLLVRENLKQKFPDEWSKYSVKIDTPASSNVLPEVNDMFRNLNMRL